MFWLVIRTSDISINSTFSHHFLKFSLFLLSMTYIFLTFPSLGLCSYTVSQPQIPIESLVSHCLMFKSFPSIKVQMKYHLSLSLFTSQMEKCFPFSELQQFLKMGICFIALITIHLMLQLFLYMTFSLVDTFLEGMISIWLSFGFSQNLANCIQ